MSICGVFYKTNNFSKKVTAKHIKKNIIQSNLNGDKLLGFKPTKIIGNFVHFNHESEQWLIPSKDTFMPTLNLMFNYDDLVSFELLEDSESVASGGLGRAFAGGILFGGAGAIVAGVIGKKKQKVIGRV